MEMKEKVITVDYLLSLFKKLSDAGKGDMKIKCLDNYLHKGEVTVDYSSNEVLFRGKIYNYDITDKVKRFYKDIEKAEEQKKTIRGQSET